MTWKDEEGDDKDDNKDADGEGKSGPDSAVKSKDKKKEEVNLLIPLVVGIIVWFVMYGYLEYKSGDVDTVRNTNINYQPIAQPLPIAPDATYRFVKDVIPSDSSEIKSFSMLTGGVSVPTKALPDVMLDMF